MFYAPPHKDDTVPFFSAMLTGKAVAQPGTCPDNIDFEAGTLTNWECKTGRVDDVSGSNTITWQTTGVNTLNHKLIPRGTAGTDPFGGFSEASPNGSAYSVKLGNSFFQNVSAESMSYTFSIADTAQFFPFFFIMQLYFRIRSIIRRNNPVSGPACLMLPITS